MNTLCRGCGVEMTWALYEKPPHKKAPIVRPPEGVRPNIDLFSGDDGQTYYRIVPPGTGEFINHFGSCSKAAQFRPFPQGRQQLKKENTMQDVQQTIDSHIEMFKSDDNPNGEFTRLAQRWASHSLECYRDDLLTKALNVSKSLSEFDAELLSGGDTNA